MLTVTRESTRQDVPPEQNPLQQLKCSFEQCERDILFAHSRHGENASIHPLYRCITHFDELAPRHSPQPNRKSFGSTYEIVMATPATICNSDSACEASVHLPSTVSLKLNHPNSMYNHFHIDHLFHFCASQMSRQKTDLDNMTIMKLAEEFPFAMIPYGESGYYVHPAHELREKVYNDNAPYSRSEKLVKFVREVMEKDNKENPNNPVCDQGYPFSLRSLFINFTSERRESKVSPLRTLIFNPPGKDYSAPGLKLVDFILALHDKDLSAKERFNITDMTSLEQFCRRMLDHRVTFEDGKLFVTNYKYKQILTLGELEVEASNNDNLNIALRFNLSAGDAQSLQVMIKNITLGWVLLKIHENGTCTYKKVTEDMDNEVTVLYLLPDLNDFIRVQI